MNRCDSGESLEKLEIGLRLTPLDRRKYLLTALSQVANVDIRVSECEIDELLDVVSGFDALDPVTCPTISQSAILGGVPVRIYATVRDAECSVHFPGVRLTYNRADFAHAIRRLEAEDARFVGTSGAPRRK